MPAKQPLSADDLYRMRIITGYELSPDGRHVIYAVQRVDRASEEKYSDLWLVSTESGEPRRFTGGDYVDRAPRWSPDGRQIAFLSNRADKEQFQLYVIPVDGGEAQRVTEAEGDFGSFVWSPDGSTLLYQFRKRDAAVKEREADPQKKKLGVVARHITRLVHKWDGQGFLPEERWHLWTVDVATGKTVQLTDDNRYEEAEPTWSPDGRWLAFVSNRTPDPDLDQINTQIFLMPAAGGYFRAVDAPRGDMNSPVFSPDSTRIAFFGTEGTRQFWRNTDLWVAPVDGSAPAHNLTAPLDVCAGMRTLGDSHAAPASLPVWSADGARLFFQVSRHGSTVFAQIAVDGGPDTYAVTLGEDEALDQPSYDDARQRMVYQRSNAVEPGDLWVTYVDTGQSRRLTHVNEALLRERALGAVEEVWFQGRDGHPLQGWIMTPPDFDPAKRYPAILEIHGGPQLQYGRRFFHEFHYLAAQGYVVYFSNPRGSQGYGNAHQDAIVNDFGAVAFDDLMAWTDHVTALPYVDAARVGVTGGSYGGYMTTTIIGRTDRFKAACAQRLVSNLISMWGSSDFNWIWTRAWGNETPWENLENYWRQSPISGIGNAKTPTLIIHSERDFRCNLEQGEQVYVALKKLGVDTELV
ncbi:MAG: S9 family peptidase, partial [Caldilineaceae bacterium]|nr:S9 family peptidase [Caldilineaceae bacterium]